LSPRRVTGVPNLCNDRGQRAGNMDKRECRYTVPASESASPSPGRPARLGTHLKPRATREERESERPQIYQKDFGRRNAWVAERRARADREPARKSGMPSVGSDTIPGHAPVQETRIRSQRR